MVTVRSSIRLHAPIDRCFRLALSIDLQQLATGQKATDGVTSGLLGPGDTVAWSGPLGRLQTLVEVWRPYTYFREIMLAGPFKAYEHEHHFATMNDGTRIRDEIRFTASMGGPLGRLSEALVKRKILRLLEKRNAFLRQVAESEEWQSYLEGHPELDMHPYQSLGTSTLSDHSGHAFAK